MMTASLKRPYVSMREDTDPPGERHRKDPLSIESRLYSISLFHTIMLRGFYTISPMGCSGSFMFATAVVDNIVLRVLENVYLAYCAG